MAKIMLALDGSVRAEQALPQARQYCGEHDELLLVRVARSLPSSTEKERHFDDYLAALAEDLRRQGVTVRTLTRFGSPARQIVEAAQDQGVDLLILCSHHQGWRRWLFGSVAEEVARLATCPVLIKPSAEAS